MIGKSAIYIKITATYRDEQRNLQEVSIAETDLVINFTYIDSQSLSDYSTMTLKSTDPNFPDNEYLQEHKALFVTWGYKKKANESEANTQTRKLYILEAIPNFNDRGVTLKLTMGSKAAYLHYQKNRNVWGEGVDIRDVAKDMADAIALNMGVRVKSHTEDNAGQGETEVIAGVGLVAANDATAIYTDVYERYEEDLKRLDEPLVQANASNAEIIGQVATQSGIQDVVLDGRDDYLNITYRDFNQKPYKSYAYKKEPYTIISFTPERKKEKMKAGVLQSIVNYDYETKTHIEQVNDEEINKGGLLTKYADSSQANIEIEDPEAYEEDLKKLNKKYSDEREKENNNPNQRLYTNVSGFYVLEKDGVDPETGKPRFSYVRKEKIKRTDELYVYKETGGTYDDALGPEGYVTAIDNVETNLRAFVPVVNPDRYFDEAEAIEKAHTKNEKAVREAKLELNKADLAILGDPKLISGKIITLLNVSKKFSGNWYVQAVEHSFSSGSAYLSNVTLYRDGVNYKAPNTPYLALKKGPINTLIGPLTSVDLEIVNIPIKEDV